MKGVIEKSSLAFGQPSAQLNMF